jgi:hypothetical protein
MEFIFDFSASNAVLAVQVHIIDTYHDQGILGQDIPDPKPSK